MSATYTTFLQYVIIAAVVVLLAPYAGCHILTTPPQEITDDAHNQPEPPAPSLKSADAVDNAQEDGDTRSSSEQLEDIQELLAR